ncbi:hypothetical protein HX021_19665 [Sphingobacterium sp. N143]|uniref:DUF6266 family protein n=1 Tax=Sphingobacterium sp. N143 TaxID=2746727 RepID=UPI002576B491|nr:DUF6266 family protein [Sphingobacterium sp. N143]MDM1296509.1 hypothetical protein [Sphingobacterium sp. N143]
MTKKIPTPAQQRARDAFKVGHAFLAPLNGLIKKGFAEMAKRKRSLPAGLALGYTLQMAIKHEKDGPLVDPALVRLSEGSLWGVIHAQVHRYVDRIEVTHEIQCSGLVNHDDRLSLCAYQVEKGYAFVNEQIWQRREGRVIVPIPEGFRNDGFHLYLLLSNRYGSKYSRSSYLGYSTK